jgi:hypothetical protein
MKKVLVVLGFLLLASSISAFAQGNYFVDYYSNNINPLAADQVIRAINTGTYGTPLTSLGQGAPVGPAAFAKTSTCSTTTRKWLPAALAA